MTTIEDVIRIAVNAHDGMKDMVGNPAISHVLAVGLMGKTVAEQKAGFLHDVVEDSAITCSPIGLERAMRTMYRTSSFPVTRPPSR